LCVDLETLAISTDAVILAIGITAWNEGEQEPFDGIHLRIDPEQPGRRIDPQTLIWWLKQDQAAVDAAFIDGKQGNAEQAYKYIQDWIKDMNVVGVWANDPSFDIAKLNDFFGKQAFYFRATRCCRTALSALKTMGFNKELDALPQGQKHHALADAEYSASIVRLYMEKVLRIPNIPQPEPAHHKAWRDYEV
jgi:hypothetical protein